MSLDAATLRDFEKAATWKIASSSKTIAQRPGWTLALSRLALGSGCCVCMVPETGSGKFSILDRIFLRDPSDIKNGYRQAIKLPRNLVSEFGYVESFASVPAWAKLEALRTVFERGFAAVFPRGDFVQDRSYSAFDDGIEVRCESGSELLLEWAAAGCPEPKLARRSKKNETDGYLATPLVEAELDLWDFGAALTWEANRTLGASRNGRFRLAAISKSGTGVLEKRGLGFALDGKARKTTVAKIQQVSDKSLPKKISSKRLCARSGCLEAISKLEAGGRHAFPWISEIPDTTAIIDVLNHLTDQDFAVVPPKYRPDLEPEMFDAQRKAVLMEEWLEAGKPKVWLEEA